MQKRAMGLETEYSVALRRRDNKYFFTMVDSRAPALLLKSIFPIQGDAPDYLKELFVFPHREASGNFWLGSNGARFYLDNASVIPEYATPECSGIREVIVHHLAGDLLLGYLRQEVLRRNMLTDTFYHGDYDDIFIFKTSALFGAEERSFAVGCHENYLVPSELAIEDEKFREFCSFIGPFLATRQIFDGAGGIVNIPALGWQYVVSPRTLFIEHVWSDDTTGMKLGRGLFNFRASTDECLPGTTRLHIISGDHTMSPWGKYIAVGATHLVLRAFEEGNRSAWPWRCDYNHFTSDLRAIAYDSTLKTGIRVFHRDGKEKTISALELQRRYASFVARSVKPFSAEEQAVFKAWTGMIDVLERSPQEASRKLDWLIKLNYLNERCGGDFASAKARYAAALYHYIAPRGIYNQFLNNARVSEFASQDEIRQALFNPPGTRAEFRSRYIKTFYDLDDPVPGTPNWGTFVGIYGNMHLRDPLARTTREGEMLLENFCRRSRFGSDGVI